MKFTIIKKKHKTIIKEKKKVFKKSLVLGLGVTNFFGLRSWCRIRSCLQILAPGDVIHHNLDTVRLSCHQGRVKLKRLNQTEWPGSGFWCKSRIRTNLFDNLCKTQNKLQNLVIYSHIKYFKKARKIFYLRAPFKLYGTGSTTRLITAASISLLKLVTSHIFIILNLLLIYLLTHI